MRTRNLLLTSILTITVIGLFGAVLSSSLLPGTASAGALMAGHLGGSHSSGGHAGHWRHSCGSTDERMIELASTWVSLSLDLTDDQEAHLQPVLSVLRNWHDSATVLCEPDRLATAPLALREAGALLDATRTSLDELLPVFDTFYGSLTAEQQARLNEWIGHHGHRS